MKHDDFYSKLITEFLRQGFYFDVENFSKEQIEDNSLLALALKISTPIVSHFSHSPISMRIHPIFKKEAFKNDIYKIYSFADIVLYKFILSQPVIATIIDSNSIENYKFKSIFEEFDKAILNFRQHAATIGLSKLGVTGIIFWVFHDSNMAKDFINNFQRRFKIFHLWKKIWSISWVIDTSSKKVYSHSGLPFLTKGVIKKDDLENNIFKSLQKTISI
ncbi:hypothetical protein [Clostridium kluyveri]|uniref:Uncharacterized protein n=1 Tax=Clostridium kluyveri TaxID=1534 RepID=A0A1L5F2X6_CLOKL|nr:hypothetical protein [Clostridium kluyveri]APM37371.1 hypothetical protein BS101_00605 [Clostridium kluyveri]